MNRHGSLGREAATDSWVDTQHRCLSCNGVIAGLAGQDLGLGLDTRFGLVSDECALICNECTARLIEPKLIEPRAPAVMAIPRR
ncbi:hypothetical protein Q2941_05375 [Bradyrhizobium sp. UFLA05-153]|uniref:hypothetical protein n=1 Tax=Bradyrhizobium sp. Ec3.3 TaxID=189753 RepID=UPI000413381D|nr:hypothetical protein [Bradyrhizobium sp. Ec3.3]